MSLVTEMLLLSETENDSVVAPICTLLTQLGYMWSIQVKSKSLAEIPTCQIIFFEVSKNIEGDLKVLQDLRSQVAFLPIIVLSGEAMDVSPTVAKLGSSILHLPATKDALEKKILRHLEPREGHQVRVYTRTEAALKVTWRQEKTGTPKESKTCNISRGGAFIRENHFFPNKGDIVEITIKSERNVISGKAIVRWIYSPGSASNNAPGFGVEFLTLTPSGQQLFNSLGLG